MTIKNSVFIGLILIILSCSSDSETVVIVNEETNLVLKKVNFQFADEIPYFILFSETGLPISGNINTFSYDSENRLIENTFLAGFGTVMPRSYIYEEDLLIGLNTPSIGSTDGLSIIYGDIIYEEGNKVNHYKPYFERGVSYTFTDSTYNYILTLGYYDGVDSNNLYKRYNYEYDSEMNIIMVNEYDINVITGAELHTFTYDIAYDSKKNPYYKFEDFHPIVFNLLGFDFDNPIMDFIEPNLRRNSKQNVSSILRTRISDEVQFNYYFDYEYNQDNYPTVRTRHLQNGDLYSTLTFEYY